MASRAHQEALSVDASLQESFSVATDVVRAAIGSEVFALNGTQADIDRIASIAAYSVWGVCSAAAVFGPSTR